MTGPDIPNSENYLPQEEISTRNSVLRQVFAEPIDKLVKYLGTNFPKLEADHLTETGIALVIAADTWAYFSPDNPILPTALYTIGSIFDGIDGSYERNKHAERDANSEIEGMLKDTRTDKFEELYTFGILSCIARRRGNNFAAICYAVATMTTVLPSLFRAEAESKGYIVYEGGIGTRQGRGILGGVGIGLNKQQKISNIVSAAVAVNNIITTKDRREVVQYGSNASQYRGTVNKLDFMKAAKVRKEKLIPYAVAGIAVGAALLAIKPKQLGRI
ncbi:MAG: hypothetical protein ABSB12_01420 [Candidatus Saccharimonadales bacterium]|jgi:hypothetical protein